MRMWNVAFRLCALVSYICAHRCKRWYHSLFSLTQSGCIQRACITISNILFSRSLSSLSSAIVLSSIAELYLSYRGTYFTMILDLFWKRFMTHKNLLGVYFFVVSFSVLCVSFGGGTTHHLRQMHQRLKFFMAVAVKYIVIYTYMAVEGYDSWCVLTYNQQQFNV